MHNGGFALFVRLDADNGGDVVVEGPREGALEFRRGADGFAVAAAALAERRPVMIVWEQ